MRAVLRRVRWVRGAAAVLAAATALSLAACALVARQTAPGGSAVPHLLWPSPPSVPRVELVGVFRRASDLGIQPSFWARVASVVTGAHEIQLVRPTGVAVSGARILVADPGARRVHLYDLAERRAVALHACGSTELGTPVAVALFNDRFYVSDASAARIHVFDFDGGCLGGWALPAGSRPAGLAVDTRRTRLYVADAGAHQILGFDPQGNRVLRFGSRGAEAGAFNFPTWLAVDGEGRLYVTDALNFRVQVFDADGTLLAGFGLHGDGSGDLARPKGIGVDTGGHIYLVDALFDAVQLFDREGRYLMVFGARGREPGRFWLPSGLAVAGDRIYVADSYNQRVQIFRLLGGAS